MTCPNCGAEMNHHATKIDYSAENPDLVDSVFEGILKDVHTCPHCGAIELVEDASTALG